MGGHALELDPRRFPFRPRCSCGWHAPVFYRDAYHAMFHWYDHTDRCALRAPAATPSRKPNVVSRSASCSQAAREGLLSGPEVAGAPNA